MWMPWYLRGSYAEGQSWISELLSLPVDGTATLARGYSLAAAGHLAYCQGDYATAERMLEGASSLAEQLGNKLLGGLHLHLEATLAFGRGDLTRARRLYEAALPVFRRLDHMLAYITQVVLARVLYELGESQLAGRHAAECLSFFRASENHWGMATAKFVQAGIASDHGNHADARAGFEASAAHYHEIGGFQGLSWSLLALAHELVSLRDVAAARQYFAECLRLAQRDGDRITLARGLEGLAGTRAAESPERAVRLAAAADSVRAHLGATRHPRDDLRVRTWLDETRRALGEAAFTEAWAAGSTLDSSRAVAEALQPAEAARES
jgi:tetratricopeptide (TPR) repeat protein